MFATRQHRIGLLILSIAFLIYSMDLSVLFLAVPAILPDLAPSATEALWICDISSLMVAGFLDTRWAAASVGARCLLSGGFLRRHFPLPCGTQSHLPTALTSRKKDAGGARPG